MDNELPKVTYLFKPDLDITANHENHGPMHRLIFENRTYLLFAVEKKIVCFLIPEEGTDVEPERSSQSSLTKIGEMIAKGRKCSTTGITNHYIVFEGSVQMFCYEHSLGALLVLDGLGNIFSVTIDNIVKELIDDNMDVDEDVFAGLLKEKSTTSNNSTQINVDQHLCCHIKNAVNLICSSDGVVYVLTKHATNVNILIYQATIKQSGIVSLTATHQSIKCGDVAKLFLLSCVNDDYHVSIDEKFYTKLFHSNPQSTSSLILSSPNGPVYTLNPFENCLDVVCDLQQNVTAVVEFKLSSAVLHDDKESCFKSVDRVSNDFSYHCVSFIGCAGRCVTACYRNQQKKKKPDRRLVRFLTNQCSSNVVCCTNVNDILVLASEREVRVYKVKLKLKLEENRSNLTKVDNDTDEPVIVLEFECLKVFNLPFISQLLINESIKVLDIISCNTFGRLMRFKSFMNHETDTAKFNGDISEVMTSYQKICSVYSELKDTSLKLNTQLVSLSNIGNVVQMLRREPSLVGVDVNVRIFTEAGQKRALLEVMVANHLPLTLSSDWFITLRYRKTFGNRENEQNGIHTETSQMLTLPTKESTQFNFIMNSNVLGCSPVQCDVFMHLLPNSQEDIKPLGIYLKTCELNVFQFCDVACDINDTENPRLSSQRIKFSPPSDKTYSLGINLDQGSCEKIMKPSTDASIQTAVLSHLHLPVHTSYNIIILRHVNGALAELSFRATRDSEEMRIQVSSKDISLLAGIHYHLLKNLQGFLKKRDQEESKELLGKLKSLADNMSSMKEVSLGLGTSFDHMTRLLDVYLEQRNAIS